MKKIYGKGDLETSSRPFLIFKKSSVDFDSFTSALLNLKKKQNSKNVAATTFKYGYFINVLSASILICTLIIWYMNA